MKSQATCCNLVAAGDSQALPGFISVYLQVTGSSGKWECFASYRLSILNQQDAGKSIVRDSWYALFGCDHHACNMCCVTAPSCNSRAALLSQASILRQEEITWLV